MSCAVGSSSVARTGVAPWCQGFAHRRLIEDRPRQKHRLAGHCSAPVFFLAPNRHSASTRSMRSNTQIAQRSPGATARPAPAPAPPSSSSWTEPCGSWRPRWEDLFLAAPCGLVLLPWPVPRHTRRSS